jgi:glyoxalase family protein
MLVRFKSDSAVGGVVDIREAGSSFMPGRMGRGSVHHVAFRAVDDAEQAAMARKLIEAHGLRATQQIADGPQLFPFHLLP